MQFGIYLVTLPYLARGEDPNPNQLYSIAFDNDTEDGTPQFHIPGDWNVYSPITYTLVTGETEIAGAESGPLLASPLPPGVTIKPPKPKPPGGQS